MSFQVIRIELRFFRYFLFHLITVIKGRLRTEVAAEWVTGVFRSPLVIRFY